MRTKDFIGAFFNTFSYLFLLFVYMSDMFFVASRTNHRPFIQLVSGSSLQISYSNLFVRPTSS